MLGAIAGDVIGSVYEHDNRKSTRFPLFGPRSRFTDDSVLTTATADAILTGTAYGATYREWYRAYPDRGYGAGFRRWAASDTDRAYGSLGNGSAMRVSPVGWAFPTLERVCVEARRSAAPTHDHPEGIKGAQAVAAAIFLARTGAGKEAVRDHLTRTFGYRFDRPLDEIRPGYRFDVTCPGSVPEAITAFLESEDWEDAVRLAVSLGGDSDTIACIAGAVAEAFYGAVPEPIAGEVFRRLEPRISDVVRRFRTRFVTAGPG